MAFEGRKKRPYTKEDAEKLKKKQMGVYGIYKKGTWIYVGRGDIRDRMLAHIGGDNPCITRQKPTRWVGELSDDPVALEKKYIKELNPVCNKKVG